jgi:hypothetical protein
VIESKRPDSAVGAQSSSTILARRNAAERVASAFAAAQRETPFDAPTSAEARKHRFWLELNGARGTQPLPAETDDLYVELCAAKGVRP